MKLDLERMRTRLSETQLRKMTDGNPARMLSNGNVALPPARLLWPQLAEPKISDLNPDQGPKYSAMLAFIPGSDLAALEAARLAMLKDNWPKLNTDVFETFIHRQETRISFEEPGGENKKGKTTWGCHPGGLFVSPKANPDFQPDLNIFSNGKAEPFRPASIVSAVKDIENAFYAGCWVIPTVNLFASFNKSNPGVFSSLASVTKIVDDTRLKSGGPERVAEVFEGFTLDAALDMSTNFDDEDEDPLAGVQ